MSPLSSVSSPTRVGVVGTTTWGTTLAVRLAAQGLECRLWCRSVEEAERLAAADGAAFGELELAVQDRYFDRAKEAEAR